MLQLLVCCCEVGTGACVCFKANMASIEVCGIAVQLRHRCSYLTTWITWIGADGLSDFALWRSLRRVLDRSDQR